MDELLIGDVREQLATLADASVHCVVTSPPYWGLRDYGTATWEGGDPECSHTHNAMPRADRPAGGLTGGKATVDAGTVKRGDCKCGARRIDSQIGLEATPEAYVETMTAVFREIRRVLRDDGTCWMNLGDSYSSNAATSNKLIGDSHRGSDSPALAKDHQCRVAYRGGGIKPKDLVGIPWRVAFALQADGWYLRSDIIWSKSNPMPESVTDRPTKAHEYVFLMTKSARYWYDAEAIREDGDPRSEARYRSAFGGAKNEALLESGQVHTRPIGHREFNGTRNARTVWEIATHPFPGAHFATFPPKLAQRCILAGCPEGGTVLDPFFGSGTVGVVAEELGRKWVGIELSPKYAEMARKRISVRRFKWPWNE